MATPNKRASILSLVLLVLLIGGASQWWAARSQASLGEELSALARPGDIHMLSSKTCGFCTAARLWMQEHKVVFSECFVETDTSCAAQFQATRSPGTPAVLVRGQPQVGFDAQRVRDTLSRHAPTS